MRAGVIPITHKDCWASDTCKENPDIKLNVALYQVLPTRYKVYVQLKYFNTGSDDFLDIEASVRKKIKIHESVEAFNVFKKADISSQDAIYDIEINDKGYSTGAARILTRIKGVSLLPLAVMPVCHENDEGVEYLKAIFEDEGVFKYTLNVLDSDPNINVLHTNSNLKSWGLKDEEKWFAHKTVFTEFFSLPPESSNAMFELLSNTGHFRKLTDETNFIELFMNRPNSQKLIKSITGITILSDFYELIDGLGLLPK